MVSDDDDACGSFGAGVVLVADVKTLCLLLLFPLVSLWAQNLLFLRLSCIS